MLSESCPICRTEAERIGNLYLCQNPECVRFELVFEPLGMPEIILPETAEIGGEG